VKRRALVVALPLAFCASLAFAQAQPAQEEFVPQVGQAGKDVIWVPTPDKVVKRMLDMAKLGPKDFLVDLGSGDGRTVITAARDYGAKAMGVEFNPKMVELSRRNASAAGVANRAEFRRADIFATDFTRATVVTMYLLPDLNLKLRPRILAMRPGTRIVSHSFTMGDWEPDATDDVEGHSIYHWLVPAKVNGQWRLDQPAGALEMQISQKYQKVGGTARADGKPLDIQDARLSGDRISFSLPGPDGAKTAYSGRVGSATMQGTFKGGTGEGKWTARRM
jgi:SAM-dependent methyltransferase